jgi:hypothetical protein
MIDFILIDTRDRSLDQRQNFPQQKVNFEKCPQIFVFREPVSMGKESERLKFYVSGHEANVLRYTERNSNLAE